MADKNNTHKEAIELATVMAESMTMSSVDCVILVHGLYSVTNFEAGESTESYVAIFLCDVCGAMRACQILPEVVWM